jgi:hypothetical protein
MSKFFTVIRSGSATSEFQSERSITIMKEGQQVCRIDDSTIEVVDGKARRVLDRLWDLSDPELIDTLIRKGEIEIE